MQFNPVLAQIKNYEAGKPIELVVRDYGIDEGAIIKLASNENPYGTSPRVIEAVQSRAHQMFRYPDDTMVALKAALAAHYRVKEGNLIIGAGSDQVIDFCIRARCQEGSKILTAKTTFAMYEIYGRQHGAQILKTPSDQHDLAQFAEAYRQEGADVIFLCLPNNPLGECLGKEEVYAFLEEVDPETLVVLDGAYQEYAAYKDPAREFKAHEVIERYPNTVYLGTFSKAYGLGGMRVGFGIGNSEIIQALYKVRPPFNITTLSMVAALEALKDQSFVNHSIQSCFEEMERYESFAKSLEIAYIPSYTNFITYLLDGINSTHLAQWLLERGIIIRNLASYGLNAVRITIGMPEQNSRFFDAFSHYLENRP